MSGETLGRYFNFEKNGYDSVMALYFKPGIGEWLWENGISLEAFLENLKNVEDLDARLSLTDAGKDWLLLHSTFISEIELFLDENQYSLEAKTYIENIIDSNVKNDFSDILKMELFTNNPYAIWNELTSEEQNLIISFPMEAYNIFKNREVAESATQLKFGNNGLNDKSDAFRHAYFNAINTKKVGAYMAKLFSDAHESETPLKLLLEKQMDLFNNAIGHQSEINYPSASILELVNLIYREMLDGNLRYLSPLNWSYSPRYDVNRDGVQDCVTCLNGIISETILTPTNQ